jgi:hypothetical protein
MLTNWNYNDEAAHSTFVQVNRQKSARNLVFIKFDPSVPCAVFFDTKRDEQHTATLTQCDCKDFTRRKEFSPCMHIYALAMRLGLIEAKYLDANAKERLLSMLNRQEIERLQKLSLDSNQWGGWSSDIHNSGMQKTRHYRGYEIKERESNEIEPTEGGWLIHGYKVTLSTCECMDYGSHKLPCKHIYAAALSSKFDLPFTLAKYEVARSNPKYVPLYIGPRSFTISELESTNDKELTALAVGFLELPSTQAG